jgi:hypothetical protein
MVFPVIPAKLVPAKAGSRNPVPRFAGFQIVINSLDSGFHRRDDFLQDHQYLNLLVLIFPVQSPGNLVL